MTHIVHTKSELQQHLKDNNSIALVPTMGALHEGHLSLVKLAQQKAKTVVVSIFVNPKQFAPHEDFGSYPRQETRDIELLTHIGADIIYLPQASEIYSSNTSNPTEVGHLGTILEGAVRPHFFAGVAWVVYTLFQHVKPQVAIFGEKDFQQLAIIHAMVRDMQLPTTIIGAPIIREQDGLAMSSRNIYLSDRQRTIAPALYRILGDMKYQLEHDMGIQSCLSQGRDQLLQAGFDSIDYVSLCDSSSLTPLSDPNAHARLLVAARLGAVRLIDNISVW